MHFLCQSIQSPPDLGHVILIGCPHQEPLVHLAALHCGYAVTTTSSTTINSSSTITTSTTFTPSTSPPQIFSISKFHSNLVSICTSAGMKNERLLLLLTDKEILHESFLGYVYKLVKDCGISTLFSKEEKAKIVNVLRGDLTQHELRMSKENAWVFFLK